MISSTEISRQRTGNTSHCVKHKKLQRNLAKTKNKSRLRGEGAGKLYVTDDFTECELLTREISNKVDHTETRIASLPAGSMVELQGP